MVPQAPRVLLLCRSSSGHPLSVRGDLATLLATPFLPLGFPQADKGQTRQSPSSDSSVCVCWWGGGYIYSHYGRKQIPKYQSVSKQGDNNS